MKYTPSSYAQILYKTKDVDALIELLQKHWVLPWLPKILEKFEELRRKKEGMVRMIVKSAYELPQSVRERIENIVRQECGKKQIEITFARDNSLIGGFRVESEELLIPASLQDSLRNLELNYSE